MSDVAAVADTATAGRSRFRLAIPLFIVLLVALALLGVTNQRLYGEQLALMSHKEQLLSQVAIARPQAAVVNGPQAVATWATANGMVPIPEARAARLIAASPAPTFDDPLPTLELRTIWR
ncbi:MAG TPA: hypothetical protein VKZ43_08315 [Trueperaceae bacterium]|nr:hypothetical protein [Trueperaceae bacterium]